MSKKLTLYTNHACPWAHRAHIALAALGLEFEEVIIDLDKPREPWYLEINPRGLVPALKVGDDIITESAIVTQYLADAHPSALAPPTGTPEGALKRARINWFVETFTSRVTAGFHGAVRDVTAGAEQARAARADAMAGVVERELAPLLADAAPFFAGSKSITLAEVNTASSLLRIYAACKPEYGGLFPSSLVERLGRNPHWARWVQAVFADRSVTAIWDERGNMLRMKAKIEQLRAAAKKDA